MSKLVSPGCTTGLAFVLMVALGCAPDSIADRVSVERSDAGDAGPRDVAGGSGGAEVRVDAPAGSGGAIGTGGSSMGSGGRPGGTGGRGGAGGAGGTGAGASGTGGIAGAGGTGGGAGVAGTGGAPMPGTGGRPADAGMPAADTAVPGANLGFLVVADPTAMAAADAKLQALLTSKGYTVKIGDDDAMASQTTGARIVVLSGTCDSMKLMAKYRDVALPILVLEPLVFDDMGLTGKDSGDDFGHEGAAQIAITNAAHPLAAMLNGTVPVVSMMTDVGWGRPAGTAIKVATLAGMNDKSAVFAYEKGVVMVPPVMAPARRVALFIQAVTIANLNDNGNKLLAAAIDWLGAGN